MKLYKSMLIICLAIIWLATPAVAGQASSQCKFVGKVVHLGKTMQLDCGSIKGVSLKTMPEGQDDACECECPPNTAPAFLKEEGWKCEECHRHLMYFMWWLRDHDWDKAQGALELTGPCKWHQDGVKLLRLYKEAFGD